VWLHIPRAFLASVPAAEDSISESDSLYQRLASSATWRETSLRPESWRRALSRAPWTMRLSGLTCSRSTAEAGAASWMASLAVSPASPTATQASASESLTSETSGPPSPDWYSMLRQRSASSRTYQASLLTTGETFDPTYRPWVTRLRKASSQRRRSARLIFANASSGWPTARVTTGDYTRDQGQQGAERPSLEGVAKNWPTPSTAPEAPNTNSNTVNGPTSLGEAATIWQTPTSGGHHSHHSGDLKHTYDLLPKQAQSWATPAQRDHKGRDLPRAPKSGPSLPEQVHRLAWSTPSAMDGSAGPQDAANRAGGPSLPAQVMQTDGPDGSKTGRVLNPRFVEALMGWPSGLTDYESSVTELCQWQQRMRSVLSLLESKEPA
jgi:hypothetical protein